MPALFEAGILNISRQETSAMSPVELSSLIERTFRFVGGKEFENFESVVRPQLFAIAASATGLELLLKLLLKAERNKPITIVFRES